jgi:hypothetical protein
MPHTLGRCVAGVNGLAYLLSPLCDIYNDMESFDTLVLSLPTRNSTLRMRLWRALKESGCGVLRDGVYVLPAGADTLSLSRLESDIRTSGGFALTAELKPRTAGQLAEVRRLFDRSDAYGDLVGRVTGTRAALARLGARRGETAIRRLERALEKLARIDFFPGEANAQATRSLNDLRAAYRALYAGGEPRFSKRGLRPADARRFQKRVWATRKAPWVDRLASAWLIKKFIDRDARFAWIARPSECPKGAVGFDFDGAEFTHVKNRVTFEVLAATFSLDADPALAAIGAVVHFLDVGGIPAPDAKGLETMLRGIKEKAPGDDALLAEAMRVFDHLYAAYATASRS